MSTAKIIAELLQFYGGWGLSVILMTAIYILARYVRKLHEEYQIRQQEQNDQMLELFEKRIETDLKHEQTFKNLRHVVEQLVSKL